MPALQKPLTGHHPSSEGIRPAASRGGSTRPCRDHIAGPGVGTWPRRKNAESIVLLCTRAEPRKPGRRGLEEGPGSEDRQTDRQASQQRHTDTERERQRQVETHTETQTEVNRQTQRQTDRPRQRCRDIQRFTRDRQRQLYTEADRQTDRGDSEESLPAPGSHPCPHKSWPILPWGPWDILTSFTCCKNISYFFPASSSWFPP